MRNGYELFAGRSSGESEKIQSEGLFHTLAAAQEHAVHGRPDEWVYIVESDEVYGHWFHGGGNEAGQYFMIRRVVDV